jgi:hypothetical protein
MQWLVLKAGSWQKVFFKMQRIFRLHKDRYYFIRVLTFLRILTSLFYRFAT